MVDRCGPSLAVLGYCFRLIAVRWRRHLGRPLLPRPAFRLRAARRAAVSTSSALPVSALTGFNSSRQQPAATQHDDLADCTRGNCEGGPSRGRGSLARDRRSHLDEPAPCAPTALRSTGSRFASFAAHVPDRHPGHPTRQGPGRLNSQCGLCSAGHRLANRRRAFAWREVHGNAAPIGRHLMRLLHLLRLTCRLGFEANTRASLGVPHDRP